MVQLDHTLILDQDRACDPTVSRTCTTTDANLLDSTTSPEFHHDDHVEDMLVMISLSPFGNPTYDTLTNVKTNWTHPCDVVALDS